MCVFCKYDAKVVGEFFGYHQCCVDAFVGHAKKYGPGDKTHLTYHQEKFLENTGGEAAFMPCPKHAKQINKKGLGPDDMVSGRVCTAPFPTTDENSEEEFLEWLSKRGD